MKMCVFVGPSAGSIPTPPGVDRFAPAALGSIFLAVQEGYRRIGLVDGIFGNVPSVWHKEILYTIGRGVEVLGSSSMGALRAAELAPFGMSGIGSIFRYYRSGALTDDDEVCVLHAVKELQFRPLSLPMISIRRTFRALSRTGKLEPSKELELVHRMKRLHFPKRDWKAISDCMSYGGYGSRADDLLDNFKREYLDLKVRDYELLNAALLRSPRQMTMPLCWHSVVTTKWLPQFESEVGDLPPLEPW